jgi:hypothetical protein
VGPVVIDSVEIEDTTFSTQCEAAVEARMQAIVTPRPPYMQILLSSGLTRIESLWLAMHLSNAAKGVAAMNCRPICEKPNTGLEALVDHAVALSSVKSSDHIVITGHKGLGVLMGLCRRGFTHATCQRAAGQLHLQDCADSLWILNSHDAAELRTLIAECARDLRVGGTLVIGLHPGMTADAAQFCAVLAKCGFHCENEIGISDQLTLVCARREERKALAA